MSLQLIFGGSGSGKSDYVYRKVLEESKEKREKTFFVLVPEQFTMQTQRELVARQERHSIMNVDEKDWIYFGSKIGDFGIDSISGEARTVGFFYSG